MPRSACIHPIASISTERSWPQQQLSYQPEHRRTGWGPDLAVTPDWPLTKTAAISADGVKLVVFHRSEVPAAGGQHRIVADLVAGCRPASASTGSADNCRSPRPPGADGFMAGRAVRGDAVGCDDEVARRAGAILACERLDVLGEIVTTSGRPVRVPLSFSETMDVLGPDWHRECRG